ncbi:hypothetical protein LY76DRAFT_29112 [Colletotrichum caudatum]|nr:hypothetical protein LY76DRAFT_29112 [Colletotrichum caudatum]
MHQPWPLSLVLCINKQRLLPFSHNQSSLSPRIDMAVNQDSLEGQYLQAKIKDPENHQQQTHFRFADLVPELRELIWEQALPDRRIIRITEVAIEEKKGTSAFLGHACVPALLHVCRESRNIALAHFELFFIEEVHLRDIPSVLRPKVDTRYFRPITPK